MTSEPITMSAGASVEVAVSLMNEHRIQHLPVVDGEGPSGCSDSAKRLCRRADEVETSAPRPKRRPSSNLSPRA